MGRLRVHHILLIASGLALSIAAALIYSDLTGLTDRIFVDRGLLSFRSSRGGRILHTSLPVSDLYAAVRLAAPAVMLSVLAVAGLALFLLRHAAARVVRRWPRGWQGLTAAAFAVAGLSAFVPAGDKGGSLSVYVVLSFTGFVLTFLGIRSLVPAATARGPGLFGRWFGGGDVTPPNVLPWMTVVTFVGTLLTAVGVFGGVPHVVDGVSHLFQARILASGQLFLTSHPLAAFFDLETVVNNGRWFSQYTPGHAVWLAIGDRADASWIVNPVLGAATVPVVYALGRHVYGHATATLAALLLMVSPFFVLISSEYYSHASSLLFLMLFLLQYVRLTAMSHWWHAVGAGACLGMALLSRPLTALAVAVPVAGHAAIVFLRGSDTSRLVRVGLVGAVTLGFVGLVFLYNYATTGAVLTFGYAQATGPGFNLSSGFDWMVSLERIVALNVHLLGWPVPALAVVGAAFLAARPTHWDYLFAAIPLALLAAYAPTGYADREFGPRYVYEAIGPLMLLTARGFVAVPHVAARFMSVELDAARVRTLLRVGILLAFLMACTLSWPVRLAFYGSPAWRWAYPHGAVSAVRSANLENALVFVRGNRLWAALFLDNALPLDDEARVIYAQDRGAENGRLMAHYPHRHYFIADVTGVRPHPPQ